MNAVILAGGFGKRLGAITESMPKPMVPIKGEPCLSRIIKKLSENGIKDATLTLHYLPERIKEYFKAEYAGVKLHYYVEKTPLGTAGGLNKIKQFLDDEFLLISGDTVCDFDYTALTSFHKEKQSELTIVLKNYMGVGAYGTAEVNKNGKILCFKEKPRNVIGERLINTGIYLINKDVINLIPQNGSFDFSNDLFPTMLSLNRRLYGYITEADWTDIGSIEKYYRYNTENGRSQIGESCKIPCSADVNNSILFDGVTLGNETKVENSILCDGVLVDDGVKIPSGTLIPKGLHIDCNFDFSPYYNSEIELNK